MAGQLRPDDLSRIASAVRAVVDADAVALSKLVDGPTDDLFRWTSDYGALGKVDLVFPPGEPQSWPLDVTEMSGGGFFVVVPMWTRQEGQSDLSLELELREDHVKIKDLHVL
jgi:hypothetical protein